MALLFIPEEKWITVYLRYALYERSTWSMSASRHTGKHLLDSRAAPPLYNRTNAEGMRLFFCSGVP